VPAPEGVWLEGAVYDPNGMWNKVQKGVAGILSLLPPTVGGLVTALGSVDSALSLEVDGTSPAYGVASGTGYAVAVKLNDERRARALLFEGQAAKYTGRDVAGMTLLTPKGGGSMAASAALAHGGYLVLARNEAELSRLGPYVYRTLPTHPRDGGAVVLDVPRSAFAGPIHDRLMAAWSAFREEKAQQAESSKKAHGGRGADFADPQAILEMADGMVKEKVTLLSNLESARVTIDPMDEGLRAAATLTPSPGDARKAIDAMAAGDASALLEAPGAASVLFTTRSMAEDRASSAKTMFDGLSKALGERLPAADKTKLDAVLSDWAKGRGDTLTGAWLSEGGAFLRAPAADEASAGRAVRGFVELLDRPEFKGPLESLARVRTVAVSHVDVPEVGGIDVATFTRGQDKKAAGKDAGAAPGLPSLGLGWQIKDHRLAIAASDDPPALFKAASAKLGEDSALAESIQRLGSGVNTALVVRRMALDPSRNAAGTALVLGWGRKDARGRLDIEASNAILREIIRRAGGF